MQNYIIKTKEQALNSHFFAKTNIFVTFSALTFFNLYLISIFARFFYLNKRCELPKLE